MGTVAPPKNGLASNYNYFLHSNCEPVTELTVTIQVSENIASNIGFSIQLQAMTPSKTTGCVWQQFVFAVRPSGSDTVLECRTDYFPTSGGDNVTNYVPLGKMPENGLTDPTLPAGYQASISLATDGSGNVDGVYFLLRDGAGGSVADSGPIKLLGTPVPVSSFELNIVGPVAGLQAYLMSGAGTITYTATTPLTVANAPPPACTADPSIITAETANSVYGTLDAGPFPPGTPIVQSFGTVIPPAYHPGGAFAVSRQFGLDQTNLYAVDRAGQLVVFWVDGSGHWSSSMPLGPTGMTKSHAAVVASQQFGANNQTNVFLVDQTGRLLTFWVEGSGAWQGPVTIWAGNTLSSGQNLATSQQFGAPNQTDVFLVDHNGTLNVFWVKGAGAWNGPLLFGPVGYASKGAPLAVSAQFGVPGQTDVFVVGADGSLGVFWVTNTGGWSAEPHLLAPAGSFSKNSHVAASLRFGTADQTDVFVVDQNGQLTMFWVQGTGQWSAAVKVGSSGLAVPGAPIAVAQRGGMQDETDVFLVDTEGTLTIFSVTGAGAGTWSNATKIGPAGLAPTKAELSSGAVVVASPQFGVANQTDVFVLNQNGTNGPGWPMALWAVGDGTWSGPKALVTEV
jgi:hypothetical protein